MGRTDLNQDRHHFDWAETVRRHAERETPYRVAVKGDEPPATAQPRRDRAALADWTLSGLFAAFMLGASALPKLAGMPVAAETMSDLGWPDAPVFWIGMAEAAFTLLFLWRRTALLGAVLMMGILGGAMATQVRADSPLFSHVLFSVYLAAFMWGGLWLREPRLRGLIPVRS